MTDIWVQRLGMVLHADGDGSVARMARLPLGETMHCIIRRPRSLPQHKLYWSIVNRIADGAGVEPGNVSDVLKVASGHYTSIRTKSLGEFRFPRSIAFDKMDQTQFNEFFERCLHTVFEEWGIDRVAFADLVGTDEALGNPRGGA